MSHIIKELLTVMAINWVESKVLEHVKWTKDLASIKFENNIPIIYRQFTKIGLDIEGEIISRPYSLVSSQMKIFLKLFTSMFSMD